MISVDAIPFEPKHLAMITPKEIYRGEVPSVVSTYAFSLIYNKEIIGIVGGYWVFPKVLHIWGVLSNGVYKCPIGFHKRILHVLDFYDREDKPRRIQVEVRKSYKQGQRWVERLGFKREGLMHNFNADGEASVLYGRVNKWLL